MIKITNGKPSGPFRHLTPEKLLLRCAEEVLTPGGAGSPFVMVATSSVNDNHDEEPMTALTIDIDDHQVELIVDEKTWRSVLRAVLAEIADA